MIILGIDPGFGRIGYGLIDYTNNKYKVIEYGCITTAENSYFPRRLNKIEEDLESILDRYPTISAASIEDLYFNTNITTGIKVAEARGVIINSISKRGIDIYKMMFKEVKESSLNDFVKYYPSVAIIEKGKVKTYLRADSDDDANVYNNYEDFERWMSERVNKE